MSNKITAEVLAKSIDETKDIVQSKNIDGKFRLNIENEVKDYYIVNKAASDTNNQLNAMAIAPIMENGKPDYNNVGVVFAGTNMPQEKGASGFGTAIDSGFGGLSGEYKLAEDFLKETQKKVAKQNGNITDVAGFSQSGGYMMKMAAEHGRVSGFKTTSFDDWGKQQFDTLTKKEQEWLKENPAFLLRYQNDSWVDLPARDHEYGNILTIIGIGDHNTLSKYFDGDSLNLDRLAKDGIFAPHMTKKQVEEAAKNWAKTHGDWNPFTNDNDEAINRIKEYLKMYGAYATEDFSIKMTTLSKLKLALTASGGGLSSSETIYLDSQEALFFVEKATSNFKIATEQIVKIYQNAMKEAQELWRATLSEARNKGSLLEEWEIQETLDRIGCTDKKIVTDSCEIYQRKLDKIKQIEKKFIELVTKIKEKIAEIIQRDSELAQQLKGVN
ncbi:hypothetical protein AB6887_09360 [Carnobacterium divergens]|nr:hypothetical protein [Carnobacterium divergens]